MIRPWLQYFDDYPWATNSRYDAPQIEAQKKAVTDSQRSGLDAVERWQPFNRGGLAPRSVASPTRARRSTPQ